MYVYIWKDSMGIPFYVGLSSTLHRQNPRRLGHRNSACKQKVGEVGADNVIVELRPVPSVEEGQRLEQQLIETYGFLHKDTGTLTNKVAGGAYRAQSEAEKKATKERAPKMAVARVGHTRSLAESTKAKLRKNLAGNPGMKGWSARNGKDAEFDAKRIAGIKAAQPKRAKKMSDPAALAQRKARLKATMNSKEFKAKRAQWDTPEYRAKLSATKKAYWERRRAEKK